MTCDLDAHCSLPFAEDRDDSRGPPMHVGQECQQQSVQQAVIQEHVHRGNSAETQAAVVATSETSKLDCLTYGYVNLAVLHKHSVSHLCRAKSYDAGVSHPIPSMRKCCRAYLHTGETTTCSA